MYGRKNKIAKLGCWAGRLAKECIEVTVITTVAFGAMLITADALTKKNNEDA